MMQAIQPLKLRKTVLTILKMTQEYQVFLQKVIIMLQVLKRLFLQAAK